MGVFPQAYPSKRRTPRSGARMWKAGGVELPDTPLAATPYVDMPRAAWARLATETGVVLNEAMIAQLRGIGDPTGVTDVQEVYHPLAELIREYLRHAEQLTRDTGDYLGQAVARTPFIVGIAGSVAVGKSTVARLVAELLRRAPGRPSVTLISTDGFLLPNAALEARGLLERKGFPETYDADGLLRFVVGIKSGLPQVTAPVYSHVIYDIVPGQVTVVDRPDILVLEGLNVLQPPRWHGAAGDPVLSVSDFLDFSVYVDADESAIREWFVERFLELRRTAFTDPTSFFRQFADIDDAEATRLAGEVWDDVNGPNLRENIAPTKTRATVILRKGADHGIESVRIRKV